MSTYITAQAAKELADKNELPVIIANIETFAALGEHRYIIKELSATSAQELAKLGYHVDTFRYADGLRFEITWL